MELDIDSLGLPLGIVPGDETLSKSQREGVGISVSPNLKGYNRHMACQELWAERTARLRDLRSPDGSLVPFNEFYANTSSANDLSDHLRTPFGKWAPMQRAGFYSSLSENVSLIAPRFIGVGIKDENWRTKTLAVHSHIYLQDAVTITPTTITGEYMDIYGTKVPPIVMPTARVDVNEKINPMHFVLADTLDKISEDGTETAFLAVVGPTDDYKRADGVLDFPSKVVNITDSVVYKSNL